jgi:hypothetical protein
MDVHPPHGPIQSVKEFMVHLLAITIGLLIALGLESSVEWLHHRHVAEDARENIRAEYLANRQDIARQVKALPAEEKHLEEILDWMTEVQSGHAGEPPADFMWTSVLLRDAAWNAASQTGAVAFMKYDEVRQYSQLYALQRLYGSVLERNLNERHQMHVILERMKAPGKLSDSEFEQAKRLIISQELTIQEFRELDGALFGK